MVTEEEQYLMQSDSHNFTTEEKNSYLVGYNGL